MESTRSLEGCDVAVVGGGPAGILCAAQFAKQGATVTVYERRTLAQQLDPGIGWSIALGGVSCKAMEDAGLSSDFGPRRRSHGITIQRGMAPPVHLGWEEAHGEKNGISSFIVTRLSIVNHIRQQCEILYADRITFADGYGLVGGNLSQGTAVFTRNDGVKDSLDSSEGVGEGENAQEVRAQADIIVAADGAASRTRSLVQKSDPSLKVRREYIQVSTEPFNLPKPGSAEALATLETPSGKPYQCVPLEPKQDVTGSFAGFNYPAKSAKADPAVVSFMIGFRDNGEDFGGSLSCGTEWWKVERTAEQLLQILEDCFPQLPRLWLKSCADVCSNPQNMRTPSMVFCNKLGVGRCVFIGDAAHAVSPQLGVGCTSGLADSALLAPLAAKLHSDTTRSNGQGNGKLASGLGDLGAEWTKVRLRDARAYVRLSKSLNDFAYPHFHKNPFMLLRAAPDAVPMVLFKTRFPGRSLIDPGPGPSVALVNGGMSASEVQNTFHRAFWTALVGVATLTAVTGVAVVSVARLALRNRNA